MTSAAPAPVTRAPPATTLFPAGQLTGADLGLEESAAVASVTISSPLIPGGPAGPDSDDGRGELPVAPEGVQVAGSRPPRGVDAVDPVGVVRKARSRQRVTRGLAQPGEAGDGDHERDERQDKG